MKSSHQLSIAVAIALSLALAACGSVGELKPPPGQSLPVKPALALSLHTTKPALRELLLPRAPRLTPRELVEHGEHYARLTGYPVQFQWTLLEGVNDGDDEMDGIVELLKGKHAVLNMIPYNTIPDLAFKRPSWERARAIAAAAS